MEARIPQSLGVVETKLRVVALDGFHAWGHSVPHCGYARAFQSCFVQLRWRNPCGTVCAVSHVFLAASSIPVLIFDYRGIGASRTSGLRGFSAVAEDWSELDCGGAIKHLHTLFPSAEIVGVAHSIGSLLMGGAQRRRDFAICIFVCPHWLLRRLQI
jgi:hypothetical protein